jgi:hypothetical protein
LCPECSDTSFRHLDGELPEILQQEINDFLLVAGLPRSFGWTATTARISFKEFVRKTGMKGSGKADAS